MRDPLVLPLVAVIAGLLAGRALEFSRMGAAWPIAVLLALAVLSEWRGARWLRRLCLTLTLILAGVFAEAWHRPGPKPEIDTGPREVVTLSGCVVEPTAFSPGREQFTLELDPGARARVTLALDDTAAQSVNPPLDPPRLRYGQRVEIDARLRRPHNFQNPGAFDYEGYLARQDIYWTATIARGSAPRPLPGRCGSRWRGAIFAVREAALARIEALYPGNEYAIGMSEALLIGETSRLQKIWTENFRKTGTFHALVISGAHVAVLAGVLLFFLRLCAVGEIPAIAFTAMVAWLYALVSGFSPPVARAAGGFTLYLAARFFFRRSRVLNLLAAFAIVYLLWRPDELLDASFQLSFLSIVAIAALGAPLIETSFGPLAAATRAIADTARDPHLIPRAAQLRVELRLAAETMSYWTRIPQRWAAAILATTLRVLCFALELAVLSTVIQIGLALPMAEYFHRVSFTGVTANLIVMPLLEIVIPAGFLAIFTGWHWVAAASLSLLNLAAKAADWHARMEPSWRVADPPGWLAAAFVISLLAVAITMRQPTRSPGANAAHDSPARDAWRNAFSSIGSSSIAFWRWPAGLAALALFAVLLWQPWPPSLVPHTLELTAIDVGQGDGLLVVFPEGRTMLIDGGGILTYGRARPPSLDIGEDVVSPYLWSRGIRHIDILAATHAHADHTGGLAAIMNNFRPRELWVGPNPLPGLVSEARHFGVQVKDMRAGPPFQFAGTTVEVLSPSEDYSSVSPGNNDSLALRIRFGHRAFLLAGDMERKMELDMLDRSVFNGSEIHADVLKVGHHGSRTSTSQTFLDAVAPSVGIISAGFENSFGHPHRDVLSRLAKRHSAVLRTDLNGLVTVRTDGVRLWWDNNLQHESPFADMFFRTFDWPLASVGQ